MAGQSKPRRGDQTAGAVRSAAVRLFYEQGFEPTTLRQIAREVGITVGSVYNHISSKEDLLFSIMSGIMRELLDEMEATKARYPDPSERLQAAVALHIRFHAEHSHEVFLGNSQLRSLTPVHRAAVVEDRSAYEDILRETLEEGAQANLFYVSDARLITYAIIAIGTHVADWFSGSGRLGLNEVSNVYSDFILRALTNPADSLTANGIVRLKALTAPAS